mmetsp:Transcript_30511/g.60584  ORF Transcript_30511/g.60584 Transcript_30511/m.60584 type:complete len:254 (-) Transcript_30511:311-1072(-)
MAKEDFGKKRQQLEMFLFLFLYQIAYLAGVSSCTSLAMMEDTASSVVGYILLPFYVLGPVWYLWSIGKRVKGSICGEGDLDYKANLEEVQRKASQDLITDVKTGDDNYGDRRRQKLDTDTSGYKAAVISGLLGSFEENYWWWKLFLMLERAALAVLVHVGASSASERDLPALLVEGGGQAGYHGEADRLPDVPLCRPRRGQDRQRRRSLAGCGPQLRRWCHIVDPDHLHWAGEAHEGCHQVVQGEEVGEQGEV